MTKNFSNLLIINIATLVIAFGSAIFFAQLQPPNFATPADKLQRTAADLAMKRDATAIYRVLETSEAYIRSLERTIRSQHRLIWLFLALLAANAAPTLFLCWRTPRPEKSVVPPTE